MTGECELHNVTFDKCSICPVCEGIHFERERIIANIYDRVSDLRSCTKNDSCVEFGELIESYIYEWTEGAETSEPKH